MITNSPLQHFPKGLMGLVTVISAWCQVMALSVLNLRLTEGQSSTPVRLATVASLPDWFPPQPFNALVFPSSVLQIYPGFALTGWIQMMVTPALLSHTDTAQGAFDNNISFPCMEVTPNGTFRPFRPKALGALSWFFMASES